MTAVAVTIPAPIDRRRRQRRAGFTWLALAVYLTTVLYVLARPDLTTGEQVALDVARMALMVLGVVWCYRAAVRLKQPQWRFLGAVAAVWTVTMLDGLIDDLGDGRTAGFPSTAQFAFLIIGPLLIVALLMVGLPTVRWVGRLRVLAEACTVSPALLFMGYTLAANVLPRQASAARANLAMVLAIGLIDLVLLTVCALVLVESRTTPRLMMMLSFLFLLVGDILLGLDYWTTVSIPQGMLLLPWLGSALFFALAALHARPATVRNRTVRPLVRSMVVYTPVLIAYLIGFYQLVWGTLSVLEMTALVVTGILASGNHVAIFVENARLTQSLRTNLRTLAESERRFRLVLDELAEGVAVAGADGTVRSISARITDLLGWRPAQLVGRSIFEFVHPDDLADVRAGFDAAIGGGIGNPIMLRVLKTDGTYAPVEAEAGSYIEETAMSGLVISVRDLTLRLRQEALLREAEQRFRVAFEEAPIGILLATTSGHLIQVNAAFGSMLGLPTDQVEGRHLSELGPISELAAHDEVLGLLADAPAETTRRHRFRYQHANGAIVVGDTSISVIEQPDGRRYLIGQVQDVTRENAIAERLAYSAHHDELTGLLNRAAFMERLSSALIRRSAGETVGVIFLDVDRFKMINDSPRPRRRRPGRQGRRPAPAGGRRRGRHRGPLRRRRVRRATSPTATAADRVDELANTLAEVVTEPMSLIDGETFMTVSVGVATADRAWVTADSLCATPTRPCTRPRTEAGTGSSTSSRDCATRSCASTTWATRCTAPIERDDFALLFQPIVELAPAGWPGSRPSSAGTTPSGASSRRSTSSSWPRTPGSSSRSASWSWTGP